MLCRFKPFDCARFKSREMSAVWNRFGLLGLCWIVGLLALRAAINRWPRVARACDSAGLTLSWFSVSATTTAGTARVFAFGRRFERQLQAFYSPGPLLSLIGCFIAIVMLAVNLTRWLANALLYDVPASQNESIVSIALPGLTFPLSDVLFLWLAIAVAVGFHELGHAAAAAAYRVTTERVGLFAALFLPGAFVELAQDEVWEELPARAKLRIASAGVWHNLVLCGVALVTLHGLLPVLCLPLFVAGGSGDGGGSGGLTAVSVPDGSPLELSVERFDSLVAVNGARVTNLTDLHSVLTQESLSTSDGGFCLNGELITTQLAEHGDACCSSLTSLQCFAMSDGRRGCLAARHSLHQPQRCQDRRCEGGLVCAVPELEDTRLRLLVLQFRSGRRAHLIATPADLTNIVDWREQAPRDWLRASLPVTALGWLVAVSDGLERAVRYVLAVSASVALINAAPVYVADGAVSLALWTEVYPAFESGLRPLLLCGSGLLGASVLVSLVSALAAVR